MYDITFKLHTYVNIIALDIKALIEEISIGVNGISYRVAYWNNGERYSYWVDGTEIAI